MTPGRVSIRRVESAIRISPGLAAVQTRLATLVVSPINDHPNANDARYEEPKAGVRAVPLGPAHAAHQHHPHRHEQVFARRLVCRPECEQKDTARCATSVNAVTRRTGFDTASS